MAKGPRSKVPFRRRREGRTDYRHRAAMLKGGVPRAVVRRSNRNVTIQIVEYKDTGDAILATAVSKELGELGWKMSGKSTPAAYLTGLLAGKRAKDKGIEEAVLDIGLRESTKGAVVFAALKGLLDAGIEIPHAEEMIPPEDRISGKHLREGANAMFNEVKGRIGGAT